MTSLSCVRACFRVCACVTPATVHGHVGTARPQCVCWWARVCVCVCVCVRVCVHSPTSPCAILPRDLPPKTLGMTQSFSFSKKCMMSSTGGRCAGNRNRRRSIQGVCVCVCGVCVRVCMPCVCVCVSCVRACARTDEVRTCARRCDPKEDQVSAFVCVHVCMWTARSCVCVCLCVCFKGARAHTRTCVWTTRIRGERRAVSQSPCMFPSKQKDPNGKFLSSSDL